MRTRSSSAVLPLVAAAVFAAALPASSQSTVHTAQNRFQVEFVPTFTDGLESGGAAFAAMTGGVSITTSASEVVSGARSLKLDGAAVYAQLRAAQAGLMPDRLYFLQFRYRMLRAGRVGVVLWSPGTGENEFRPLGELPSESEGSMSLSVLIPPVAGATFIFYALDASVAIDEVRIEAQVAKASRAAVPVIRATFPRLGDYMLLGPAAIAGMHGRSAADAEQRSANYDLLVGSGFDHTRGAAAWIRRVRAMNSAMLILPYRQAYMAQFDGSVGLNAEFNAGLPEAWFMRSPDGDRLAEPSFPQNVQLNHTPAAPTVGGMRLADYTASFLARRMMPSGLWDGIQFDQAEWYVNPLLGSPPPPIDVNNDGRADAHDELQRQWADGFVDFFRRVHRQFGVSSLIAANAGYLSANPTALRMANGWIAERVEPYPFTASGDWDTRAASGWYRLLSNYQLAGRIGRAPQLPLLQFTGAGLGTATGTVTPNGLPMRTLQLEARDYRRMRFGLATTLLGNGFFEYDLVDNTTPAQWFDEFAVDSAGNATTAASGKGYLGQPLGDAAELAGASRPVFSLDFETATLPANVYVNGRISTTRDEVVSGNASLVVTKSSVDEFAWFLWAAGHALPGRSYQFRADYRILSVQPSTHQGLLGLGFLDAAGQLPPERLGSLFMPDVDGPGQQGTLRASIKADGADAALGMLFDLGTVALDNIRLTEGPGGVWRRDFENGIVLVNPTPEAQTVSLADIAGALQRTGVRRIRGAQVPEWNSGQSVASGGITLPSGDAIILLANRVPAAPLGVPANMTLSADATTVNVAWTGSQAAAGYEVRYGEDPAHLTRVAAVGQDARVAIEDLQAGATYYVRVTPYDFGGRFGPSSAVRAVTLPGTTVARPSFTLSGPGITPGAVAVLTGTGLADTSAALQPPYPSRAGSTRVEINGIEAPLYWIAPHVLVFITPWEIAGTDAVLNVIRGGVAGVERLVRVKTAIPNLLDTGSSVMAWRQNGSAVTAGAPARPGEVIEIFATGLGAVTVPPDNGVLPAPAWIASATTLPVVTIAGVDVAATSARLEPQLVGVYRVTFTLPGSLPSGPQAIQLRVGDEVGNVLSLPVQ